MEVIPKEGFRDKLGFLSNFYSIAILYKNNRYRSAEHAYQAAKTISEEDRIFVAAATNPGEAKRRGRKIVIREDWEDVKWKIMWDIVYCKFDQHPNLQEKLLLTNDIKLVEFNTWHDTYYGCCTCNKHNGTGENVLGKILMSVRQIMKYKKEEENGA